MLRNRHLILFITDVGFIIDEKLSTQECVLNNVRNEELFLYYTVSSPGDGQYAGVDVVQSGPIRNLNRTHVWSYF